MQAVLTDSHGVLDFGACWFGLVELTLQMQTSEKSPNQIILKAHSKLKEINGCAIYRHQRKGCKREREIEIEIEIETVNEISVCLVRTIAEL